MTDHSKVNLTPTQHKIMELIADGFGPCEVAVKLGRSQNTISTHLIRVKKKMGARSTIQAAVKWAVMRAYSEAEYRSWCP
jgi:DNA-binding NarL/FixJ family response regulator